VQRSVSGPVVAFLDRAEAGRALADFMALEPDPGAAVLAVPRGGVPVAEPLARALGSALDIVPVRKLPIPQAPEAGFGAVALDGSTVLNDDLVLAYRLTESIVEQIRADVLDEVHRRAREYRGHDRAPELAGRRVYLVDDGLASGYTMVAAAQMAREAGAARVVVCIPVAPVSSIDRVAEYVDHVVCLIAQKDGSFAVASFYEDFRDLSDADVRRILLPPGAPESE
jgi:putative phosphoribosyl transferase